MKHTPGPWKARKVPAGNWFIEAELKHNKRKAISQIFEVPVIPQLYSATLKKGMVTIEMAYSSWYQFEMGDWNEEAWEGNAHLMAAAPDLLAACEFAREFLAAVNRRDEMDIKGEANIVFNNLIQAIRKAEGNEK